MKRHGVQECLVRAVLSSAGDRRSTVCGLCVGVNVARMLIDRGDLVLIADNQGVRDIYSADGNSIDKSTPLVVLVNKGTASASEVSDLLLAYTVPYSDSNLP